MTHKLRDDFVDVRLTKLVEGGQALGMLPGGKKVFVWNALPGENVRVRLTRQKHSYATGVAEEIIEPSSERTAPEEANFLATSPWQIMTFDAENRYKKNIVEDLMQQHNVTVPDISGTTHDDHIWRYRNKMEYSFWGDEQGLHLALHHRASHGKHIVTGSRLAMEPVDAAADSIRVLLDQAGTRAGDLKTIIVRSSQNGAVVASLFVKPEVFPELPLPAGLQGMRVYHSNPRSPASVPTRLLWDHGDAVLTDELLGRQFIYDVDSFFQVNIPVFELALQRIKEHCAAEELVDMYAGVGSIGLSVAQRKVDLVELDPATARMARLNARQATVEARVIEASTEKVLDYIVPDKPIVFDPPRAGLHDKVAARVIDVQPPNIVYLSCNPATQARDLAKLQEAYDIRHFEVFNFFPRTPHIETLAILERR